VEGVLDQLEALVRVGCQLSQGLFQSCLWIDKVNIRAARVQLARDEARIGVQSLAQAVLVLVVVVAGVAHVE